MDWRIVRAFVRWFRVFRCIVLSTSVNRNVLHRSLSLSLSVRRRWCNGEQSSLDALADGKHSTRRTDKSESFLRRRIIQSERISFVEWANTSHGDEKIRFDRLDQRVDQTKRKQILDLFANEVDRLTENEIYLLEFFHRTFPNESNFFFGPALELELLVMKHSIDRVICSDSQRTFASSSSSRTKASFISVSLISGQINSVRPVVIFS